MDRYSSTVFGVYESMRILIPGFYFATLLTSFYWCFLIRFAGALDVGIPFALLFLFLSIVSGLTMYAKETPKRRRAFLENQPSNFLKERSKLLKNTELLEDASARKLYFYLLNNHMPQTFHDKIFFFGTIYHIMILLRRTTFWFALAAIVGVLSLVAAGHPLAEQAASVLFTVSVWLIYLLNVRYNKADRKMQENYQDQIFWLEMNQDIVENAIRLFSRSRRPATK